MYHTKPYRVKQYIINIHCLITQTTRYVPKRYIRPFRKFGNNIQYIIKGNYATQQNVPILAKRPT